MQEQLSKMKNEGIPARSLLWQSASFEPQDHQSAKAFYEKISAGRKAWGISKKWHPKTGLPAFSYEYEIAFKLEKVEYAPIKNTKKTGKP